MEQEFDNLKHAIKVQLEKDRPTLSQEELDFLSNEIAEKEYKELKGNKAKKENVKLDKDGMIIVGESVKVLLDSSISAGDVLTE